MWLRHRSGIPLQGANQSIRLVFIFFTIIAYMTKGPIIIVEDDPDDQEIYAEAIRNIGISNEIKFFEGGATALEYLITTDDQPFIILSDVNMPIMSGLELKEKIQKDDYLRLKGIPFVFISTNASATAVRKAHELSVQGYFEKPSNLTGIRKMLTTLFDYWALCRHINNTKEGKGNRQ